MNENDQVGHKQVSLGAFLRDARERANLSKLQLEAMSSVGRMTVTRLESDQLKDPPSAEDLARLARALELNETDLFLLAGLPVPKEAASLDVMLRTEYGLPAAAIEEARQHIAELASKYERKQNE